MKSTFPKRFLNFIVCKKYFMSLQRKCKLQSVHEFFFYTFESISGETGRKLTLKRTKYPNSEYIKYRSFLRISVIQCFCLSKNLSFINFCELS